MGRDQVLPITSGTQFRIYPLSKIDNPPKGRVVNASGAKITTIHSNDYSFYEGLNAVVQYDPAGLFAAIDHIPSRYRLCRHAADEIRT